MSNTLVLPLTDTLIRRHGADPAVRQIRDPRHGLLFRYHRNRQRGAFHLRHYQGGRERWRKVGGFPELSVKALLPHLSEIRAQLAVDPAAERLGVSPWASVADLLTWYRDRTADNAQLSANRRSTIKSAINRHLVPLVGGLGLLALDRATLDERLIWPLQAAYSLAFVKSVFGVLKAAYKQAHRLARLETDPLASWVFGDFIQARITPKPPALTADRLPGALQGLPADPVPARMIPLLMLLHGTRIGETRRHRWAWIDWDARALTIPGDYTKNGQAHRIPLTPVALQLLRDYQAAQRRRGVSSVWLFPGKRAGRPLSKTAANELFQHLSGGAWTSHDLRKVARTVWTDLGVDYIVGEQLLNHTLKDLDATYIHTAMQLQKKAALEQYHAWLLERLPGLASASIPEPRVCA